MTSYTVLVRRYQNQGITLQSRASSPSEASTPATFSSYNPDDEYSYDGLNAYDTLMPPQGTSAGSHRSWSSLDSEAAVSAWSTPHDYTLPMAAPASQMTHATHSMSDYAFTQPRPLSTGVSSPPHDWNWASTSPMNPSAPMQARSPVSYSTPAPPHYDDYGMLQPVMSPDGHSYSRSPARASYPGVLPNAVPTSLPRARAWSEQQPYDSLSPTTYPDPRLQQNPLYRF
jgi:hypothetical protein